MAQLKYYLISIILLFLSMVEVSAQFDIQAHRGCRGLMPENTIEGFIHAVDLGAHTLEMDVVITGDGQVLVSHDTFMSHEFCLDSNGREIPEKEERKHSIFKMDMEAIQTYDCGSHPHPRFPHQQKFRTSKPLLSEVIDSVESHVRNKKLKPVNYNIEIKSKPVSDGIDHPEPKIFTDLVMRVILDKNIQERTILQSFDPRILQILKNINAPVQIALLVENLKSQKWNLRRLGFIPDIYSPHYKLLSKRRVKALHEQGMKVIPWTINTKSEMIQLKDMGVDGIITDYPDRLVDLLNL